ncbi:MAG: SDR family NAD(P)-dependent oxidoreductase [Pseudomonadota bacterium]
MRTVITGGANGLGRALALAAQAAGHEVVAVDHAEAALSELPVAGLALDLTGADAPARIAALGPIDLIIHSAGISGTGPFEAIPPEHHARILDLNFRAPLAITAHLLAEGALAQGSTHAFVASLSRFTGYPGAVSYAASKDGLASFARSLDKALPRGQRAAVIYPGPLATEHAARYAPDNSARTVAARLDPARAAEIILKGLAQGRRTIIPGGKAKLMAAAGVLAPGPVGRLLRKGLYEKLPEAKL